MSASSGITVSPDLLAHFADAVNSDDVRFLKVVIQQESLVLDLSIPPTSTLHEDLAKLQDDNVLAHNIPAYILAKLDRPSPDWIVFYYVPENARVRDKMLYASTRAALVKSLGSTVFTDSIFAMSKSDLTVEAYQAHLQHLAAPKPLSAREQEMSDLRAAENSTASYEGSRARTSHVGAKVGFKCTPELEDVLVELARGNGCTVVVMTVDPQTETLQLQKPSSNISIHELATTIPDDEPTYSLFGWPQSLTTPPRRELVFVYSCPSKSPVKHRMLYSSGKTSTWLWIKDLLSTAAPAVNLNSRKIETSEPKELTEEYIIEELRLKSEEGGSATSVEINSGPKPFAKPKGPPRRR